MRQQLTTCTTIHVISCIEDCSCTVFYSDEGSDTCMLQKRQYNENHNMVRILGYILQHVPYIRL